MRWTLADTTRLRAEIHGPEHLWSKDAHEIMSDAAEAVRIEERLSAKLAGAEMPRSIRELRRLLASLELEGT